MNWKACRSKQWPNLRYCPSIFLELNMKYCNYFSSLVKTIANIFYEIVMNIEWFIAFSDDRFLARTSDSFWRREE
jgi:hypothetical protein